jgi:TRAP transporter TAXI family solute receptor
MRPCKKYVCFAARTTLIAIIGAVALLWFPVTAKADIGFAAGPSGGKYYPVARQIASILFDNRYLDSPIPIEIQSTHGSVDNIRRLCKGHARLAIVQSDILYRNHTGQRSDCDTRKSKNLNDGKAFREVRGLAALFGEYIQVIVDKNSRISNLIDLSFNAVSVGHEESGTYKNSIELLESVQKVQLCEHRLGLVSLRSMRRIIASRM